MNVALLIYRRPELTERVFHEIAKMKPLRLFIVADGPRAGVAGEADKVAKARAVVDKIDWTCEVLKNYSDVNLGCKKRVSSGLDWVFEQVEDAIILEDDCLPDPTFFHFCEELLGRYRNDTRVMHISGDNFQRGVRRSRDSYYFSKYAHIWGWATWRRAWKDFDYEMKQWPSFRSSAAFRNLCSGDSELRYWEQVYSDCYSGLVDTWDYAWMLSVWEKNGLAILPDRNLVSNIGFTADATHAAIPLPELVLPREAQVFPLRHPAVVGINTAADEYTTRNCFLRETGTLQKFFRKLERSSFCHALQKYLRL